MSSNKEYLPEFKRIVAAIKYEDFIKEEDYLRVVSLMRKEGLEYNCSLDDIDCGIKWIDTLEVFCKKQIKIIRWERLQEEI